MSRVLEDRVWQARPLSLADRCVLLAIARDVADGQTEVKVPRQAFAERLQTTSDQITRGLRAGEALGLCALLRNGGVAFTAYDLRLGESPRPAPAPLVLPVRPEDATPLPARPKPNDLLAMFAKHWTAKYRQAYAFTPGKDHRLAKALLAQLPLSELERRVRAYLASDDQFFDRVTHAFSVFVQRVNEFVVRPQAERRDEAADTREYLRRQRERSRGA